MRDSIMLGPVEIVVETSPETAAESLGEYVSDAIAADLAISDAEVYDAARVAARYAAIVIGRRWPAFGEDWR